MSYYQQPGAPQGWPQQDTTPPRRHRGLKVALISGCLVLALVFAGTAYLLFFSGAPPKDVVEEYVSAANSEDFGTARDLACDDANESLRFEGSDLDHARTLFHSEAMTWSQRDVTADGSEATVIVDQNYRGLPDTVEPFSLRIDYHLERNLGTWEICEATQYYVDANDSFAVNDCTEEIGLQFFVTYCGNNGALTVVDEVTDAADCPNSRPGLIERESDGKIQCVDMGG